MAAQDVSPQLGIATAEPARPTRHLPAIAGPIPVGIAGFALRTNVAVRTVFITLTATYLLLVLAELGVASSSLLPIAGYVGITCGVTASYVACAHVTSAAFGRGLIPTRSLA